MSEIEETKIQGAAAGEFGKPVESAKDECADIDDPVRRTLCKVCQAPVIGTVSFCRDHEPPVP
jgi:hypothetical protein